MQKEDENKETCQCFIGETPSFTFGRDHVITKIWEKAFSGTQRYLRHGRDSLLHLACVGDGQCLKDLIKQKGEGSHNLGMHTCWAEMMFGILNKVQEPAVNFSLSMNQQRARVLGAAWSQGHCELRGTLPRAVDGEWD